MEYFIQRGEQKFGPYTLAELQQYVQAGSILPVDLAQSEGMSGWVAVSQVLGNIPIPQTAPAAPVTAAQELVPLPPNLHWALLMVLFIVGQFLGPLFLVVHWAWSLVLANWARKLSNNNRAMVLVAMYPAGFVAGILTVAFATSSHNSGLSGLGALFILGGAIIYIFGIFKIREAMEDYYNSRENIALTLSGVMTFFFSTIYLQYHVNRIARWKKTGILS